MGLTGFGSGSHCLYVRVRNENVVSMQGRASQRQTGRSGLAAESVLGPVGGQFAFRCVLAWTERGPRAQYMKYNKASASRLVSQ